MNAALISGLDTPTDVAVSGTNLFVFRASGAVPAGAMSPTGIIGEYTITGAVVNASLMPGISGLWCIAAAGGNLYLAGTEWHYYESTGPKISTGWFSVTSISGTSVDADQFLGLTEPLGIAATENRLVILLRSTVYPNPLSVAEFTTSGVALLGPGAGPQNVSGAPVAVAAAGSNLFVLNSAGTVGAYATSGSAINASLLTGLIDPIAIATSGSFLYVLSSNGTIGKYTTTGVTVNAALVTGLSGVGGFAVSPVAIPTFTTEPDSATVASGQTASFSVSASGVGPLSYQWAFNGLPIAGATDSYLVVPNTSAANVGTYGCVVTDANGTYTQSVPATLTLSASTDLGRLINLSANTYAGPSNPVTIGFCIGGAGTSGSQSVLLRGMGPSLAEFSILDALPDPTVTVFNGSTVVASNDNWGSNQTAVAAADTATGAFAPISPISLDAALVASLAVGNYTMQVAGNGTQGGQALAECYDDTWAGAYTSATPRLVNLSCRTNRAAGATLTAGFVIGGSTSRTVLVRAVGPALSAFGVTGTMVDPQLTVFDSSGNVVAANAGWGGDIAIAQVSGTVGAFPLTNPGSTDSAVLATLPPGAYTAQANSVSGGGGEVLIEVYDVP